MKRTFQPNVRKRAKKHGFRHRMATRAGQAVLRPAPKGPSSSVRVGRLRGRRAFAELGRHGRRVRRSGVTVTFVPRPEDTQLSVGFAIGRKVGSAVVRNRTRRRLRAVVAEPGPHQCPGWLLITVAPEAAQLEYGELRTVAIAALREVMAG